MVVTFVTNGGIGDVLMTAPFVKVLLDNKIDVIYQTAENKFGWLKLAVPGIRTEPISNVHPSDHLVFNLCVVALDMTIVQGHGLTALNFQQSLLASLVFHQLPVPADFKSMTPSIVGGHWSNIIPNGKPILFTSSMCAPSRLIGREIVAFIISHWDVEVNPVFDSEEALFNGIAGSSLVIAPDTGPIHIAETTRTPWVCLNTSMAKTSRFLYYTGGQVINTMASCSPCQLHNGCSTNHCVNEFDLQAVSDAIKSELAMLS